MEGGQCEDTGTGGRVAICGEEADDSLTFDVCAEKDFVRGCGDAQRYAVELGGVCE